MRPLGYKRIFRLCLRPVAGEHGQSNSRLFDPHFMRWVVWADAPSDLITVVNGGVQMMFYFP